MTELSPDASRRARQCHKPGCDSQAVAQAHLRLWFSGLRGQPLPLDMASTVNICLAHRAWAAQWLMSPANKEAIAKGLAAHNLGEPDYSSAEVAFVELERPRSVIELDSCRIIVCDLADCILPAKFQVALKLWQIGQGRNAKPMQALINYCVCNRHRGELKADQVLDRAGKSKVLGELTKRGVAMPDFRRAELAFIPLVSGKRVDPAAFEKGAA